jgi:hypothetical protein
MNDRSIELIEDTLVVNRRNLATSARTVLQHVSSINGNDASGREALPISVVRLLKVG